MNEKEIYKKIAHINDTDTQVMSAAMQRQDSLAKPPGSLGILEDISVKLAGITGRIINEIKKPAVIIMSADNGVTAQGVSSAPKSVTMAQTINFTKRLTGVGALSKTFGADLLVADVGIDGNVPKDISCVDTSGMFQGKILDRKVSRGTADISLGAAMSRQQALDAISTGLEIAHDACRQGYDIFGVGEMGIGNTTSSTALLSAMTGMPSDEITGRGGGITDESYENKKAVIKRSLRVNGLSSGNSGNDTIDMISKVGGFDIAAMTGAFLGAAESRTPVVIDGYISAVAALAALSIEPKVKGYMFASHKSLEPGYAAAMERLDLDTMLDLNMRLGEGSGCVLAFQIIKGACGVMNNMATFPEASINDKYLDEIRKGDCF